MKHLLSGILLCVCGLLMQHSVMAQEPAGNRAVDHDSTRPIHFSGDKLTSTKIDSVKENTFIVGQVFFVDRSTKFYCDSAIYRKPEEVVEAFGHVHIIDSDTVNAWGDYMIYYKSTRIATLKKNVKMTDGKATLTTDEFEYNSAYKTGTYRNGGKLVNGKTVMTSTDAIYYSEMKDVYFRNNVKLRDPQYKLDSDSLLYNTQSQIATFITKTFIEDSAKRKITTKEGFYDTKNKLARFGKRPTIVDGSSTITGEDVGFDDQTGENYARGNAVFKDTAQGIAILANSLKGNRNTNTMIATEQPLAILKQDKDSIYISADTLFSGLVNDTINHKDTILIKNVKQQNTTAIKNDSTLKRYLLAYYNVRIFSDSTQAICDSLYYSGADSIFRLITHPIVWANKSQVTGDTIYLYTQNKKPSRFYVFENGIMINRLDEGGYFNQLQGHTINGYFKDGAIDYVRAKGSAESIYYAQDEHKAFIGVNRATADIIDIRFLNKEVNKVVFISEPNGTMNPFSHVNNDEMRLKNFRWLDEYRPKSKFELFEPAEKKFKLKDGKEDDDDDDDKKPEEKPVATPDSTAKKSQ